jgi:hypothetical protein
VPAPVAPPDDGNRVSGLSDRGRRPVTGEPPGESPVGWALAHLQSRNG